MDHHDYLQKNKSAWNHKTEHHVQSDFYDLNSFLEGKNSLCEIELNLLSDIKGKSILHLQCHFGQDTLSLQRMGAICTGVDLSDKAIDQARKLNDQLDLDAQFIVCDIYSLPNHLEEQFDIVFTSYGTIGWLPDIDRWAEVVAHFLKPGGQFIFAEFHPFVWTMDYEMKSISYDYFQGDAIVEQEEGTYADREAKIQTETVSWNHGLAEVIQALLDQDLQLDQFHEHHYSPHPCFSNLEEFEPGKFRFKHIPYRIPMVYSLVMEKNLEPRN